MHELGSLWYSIQQLDQDYGVPVSSYLAAHRMIEGLLGENAATEFANAVEATDGYYYITENAKDVFNRILDAAKE